MWCPFTGQNICLRVGDISQGSKNVLLLFCTNSSWMKSSLCNATDNTVRVRFTGKDLLKCDPFFFSLHMPFNIGAKAEAKAESMN